MNSKYVLRSLKDHLPGIFKNALPGRHPDLRKNEQFRNMHLGKRCFILGSGHSVSGQDLTRLNGEIVMTQNHFHAHADIAQIRPAYHVIVPKYQPPEFDPDWVTWFRSMEERLPRETLFFMGLNTKKLVGKHDLFRDRAFYVQPALDPLFLGRARVDLTRRVMIVPTVLTQCLTVALFMGFSQIYLAGFDLDQHYRKKQPDQVRFYGHSPITKNAAETAIEQNWQDTGREWFHWWLMFKQLMLLRTCAERRGQEIINVAPAGLLDCFRRQRYEDVIPARAHSQEPA